MDSKDWLTAAAIHIRSMRQVEKGLADLDDFSMHHLTLSYMLLSCLYYDFDDSVVSDETYDYLCQYLLANFELIETMKDWIDKDSLQAGTAFHLTSKFPRGIDNMAYTWHEYMLRRRR